MVSEGTKDRLSMVIELGKTVFHYGWIPSILYIGFKTGADPGMPELSVFNLLW